MNRFVSIDDRFYKSMLFFYQYFNEYVDVIRYSKWKRSKWKGLTLMKDPFTQSIYLQLLQELKPKTILELGAYEGGGALWLNDMMKSLNQKCEVHTFDINVDRVNVPSDIIVHEFDNYKAKEFVKSKKNIFQSLEHPILLIEDSHLNFIEVLNEFDAFLSSGDYVVVEDTLDKWKHEEMIPFARDSYLVDTYYCDFWGHNHSWNVNSFLVKK